MAHTGTIPLARNTPDGNGTPVIIKDPSTFLFAPDEVDAEWHGATDQELADYDAYWSAMFANAAGPAGHRTQNGREATR